MRTLKKQCLWKWAILLLLLVIIGTVSFLTGRYVSDSSTKEEQAHNVQLNRSDLEGLSEIEGTIYVTGHQSPDSDTVSSSIAYAALLNALGYDARPVVLGDINNETKYILDRFKIKYPRYLNDVKLQIRDFSYHKGVFSSIYSSLEDIYKFMNENNITGVPIIDENNKFVDMVTAKMILKESFKSDSSSITPGSNLTIESVSTIEGNTPPVKT